MSESLFREKMNSLKGSTVYKDEKGKWRLAEVMVVVGREIRKSGGS